MKIAIFGSTGLLGSNLRKLYSRYNLKTFSRSEVKGNKDNVVIDFLNIENELENHFKNWKPDIIINTIALVNLQQCEDDLTLANFTNCEIAKNLAITSQKLGSYYIHISTDHYFDDKKELHTENDNVKILNNYALTKFNAEKEVLSANRKSLIVRTNIIGFRNSNRDSFFEWLLKSIKDKSPIKLYTDFFTSPISVNLLGEILLKCYNKKLFGIYNIASCEVIDKYEFGIKTAKKFGLSYENIEKATIKNENLTLKRALTLGLDVSKIQKSLEVQMPTVNDTLEELYKDFYKGK